ncbi:MAG: CRTAC1 family protein [Planctomycetota bacterium]
MPQNGPEASDGAESAATRVTALPAFRDVTAESGVRALHEADLSEACRLPEPLGPGVGLLDFDGDGQLDIFVTAGGALPPEGSSERCQLWSRDSSGRFREIAATVGADIAGPAYGVACGDYDADGDEDLFVTRLGADVLLRNDGGRFVDATETAGVGASGFNGVAPADALGDSPGDSPGDSAQAGAFGCSATFFDYDRDGFLDLYITQYVDWSPIREHECILKGRRDYCSPTVYDAPTQDRLLRNLGNGSFEDATQTAGITGHLGNGLGVVALDFDSDGWDDLYVANDVSPAFLWHNQRDGTFAERALECGAAYSGAGVAISGMGVVSEDLNGDGRPDLLVTNIGGQSHLGLMSRGKGFYDGSNRVGITRWSIPATAFGLILFDQDLDGELDLYVGNGSIQLGEPVPGKAAMAEDDQFARWSEGRFQDATSGSGALQGRATRAIARGDLDGDGDEDLVLTATGDALSILRNDAPASHHWLAIDVLNQNGGYALGATVDITLGGATQRRRVRGQESYLASSSPRIHIGLGEDAPQIEQVTVIWSDGEAQDITGEVKMDSVTEVRRGV